MDHPTRDDYWQELLPVAPLPLPPRDDNHEMFFLWHQARERYGRNHREIGIKLTRAGERDYIHAKACYFVPRVTLTIGLTPPVQTEFGKAIGHVLAAQQEGHDRIFLAGLQAWYYGDRKTLMLWEVDLLAHDSDEDPTQDFLLATLWHGFEQELLTRFSDCERIVTPGWEPKYEQAAYRTFLAARGYTPHQENTYHKMMTKQKGGTYA